MVLAAPGWTEYAVLDAKAVQPTPDPPSGLNITHYLGALGGTGLTAYYGLKVVAEAEPSDRVVISGAAGATGSMAVQIAKKLIGWKRVIGIAGSDEKCRSRVSRTISSERLKASLMSTSTMLVARF
jgi:NADPH-dependent curcumin reductase CurA